MRHRNNQLVRCNPEIFNTYSFTAAIIACCLNATADTFTVTAGTFTVTAGNFIATNGTFGANVIHLKSVMTKQPAALPSHFLFQKDERELRAREVSLGSLPYSTLRGGV